MLKKMLGYGLTAAAAIAAIAIMARSAGATPPDYRYLENLARISRATQASNAAVSISGTGVAYLRSPIDGRIKRIWAINNGGTTAGITPTTISLSIAGVYVSGSIAIPSGTVAGTYISQTVSISGTVHSGDIIKVQSGLGQTSGTNATVGASICPTGIPTC